MDSRTLRRNFAVGLLAGLRVVWPILSILLVLIISALPYKTPWVMLSALLGLIIMAGSGMEWISYRIKGLQSGKVQQYGLFFLFGVIIIVSVYLFKNVPWR